MRIFKFGKYIFKNFQHYREVQELAFKKGFENTEDFNIYLDDYFSE